MSAADDARRLAEIRAATSGRTQYEGRAERVDEFLLRLLDEALAANARLRAVAVAARQRLTSGHNDTCSFALVHDAACDCGHDALRDALAALQEGDLADG